MAVPSNYRWIAVGSLLIRNRTNSAANAPEFSVNDLFTALSDRSGTNRQWRSYGGDSRLMWCEHCADEGNFYRLLLQTGDKNVAGVSFFHFENKESRDVEKEEDEGGHYTAHVLIKKQPEADGRHVILVEKVPGIYLSSVKDHFAWVCNDPIYQKSAPGPDGRLKSYRAIFEVDGFQAQTLKDALEDGVLKDIEFVSFETENLDGHDEDELIDEVVREAVWKVGKRVNGEQARGLLDKAKAFMDDFTDDPNESQLFVRIKTASGQIKRTEIDQSKVELLEQAFVQNEVIGDFDQPLPPKYEEFHGQVLQKMTVIGVGLGD